MSRTTHIPRIASALAYVGAACTALFAVELLATASIARGDLVLTLILAVVASATSLSQARLSKFTTASITDIPLIAAVLLLPAGLGIVVAISAGAIPRGRLGNVSRALNVTVLGLPVGLAGIGFEALRRATGVSSPQDGALLWLGAAILAVTVIPLVHHPLMGVWNRLAYHVPFLEWIRDGALPLLKADPISAFLIVPLCEIALLLDPSARFLPGVFASAAAAGTWLLLRGGRRQIEARDLKDEFFRAIFVSFASLLEMKDPETARHSARVAKISRDIAQALGLPKEEQSRIHLAGLLHDVGKVGVPDEILLKVGRLSDDERMIMQRHARMSAEAIAGIPGFGDLTRMVYAHHERLNGSGYPEGIGGDDLPLGARILGVADTFEALTSNRPYRQGRSHLEALEIFEEEIYLFDRGVVDAMRSLVLTGLVIYPEGTLKDFSGEWSEAARHLEVRLDEEGFQVPPERPSYVAQQSAEQPAARVEVVPTP